VQKPKKIFCTPQLYFFNVIKLIILPLLVCVITKLIGVPQPYAIFLTAAAALPSASATTMMAETYDVSAGYASLAVGTSSLLSILTIPLTLTIAQYIFAL
jgi:predicted permease